MVSVDDNIEIYLSLSAIALRSICKVYQVDGRWGRADVPVLDDAKCDSIVKCKRERTIIEWAHMTVRIRLDSTHSVCLVKSIWRAIDCFTQVFRSDMPDEPSVILLGFPTLVHRVNVASIITPLIAMAKCIFYLIHHELERAYR